jgi:hypothetical protein
MQEGERRPVEGTPRGGCWWLRNSVAQVMGPTRLGDLSQTQKPPLDPVRDLDGTKVPDGMECSKQVQRRMPVWRSRMITCLRQSRRYDDDRSKRRKPSRSTAEARRSQRTTHLFVCRETTANERTLPLRSTPLSRDIPPPKLGGIQPWPCSPRATTRGLVARDAILPSALSAPRR